MLKKSALFVFVLMFAVMTFASAVFAEGPLNAEATKGTPVVDGDIDSVWGLAKSYNGFVLKNGATSIDPSFRVLWDENYLYVLVEVKDASVGGENNEKIQFNDGMDIYLDLNNGKTDMYDDDDWRFAVDWRGTIGNVKGSFAPAADTIKASVKKTGDGYLIEASAPWLDSAKANIKENSVIGFDVQVTDNVDNAATRSGYVGWSGTEDTDFKMSSTLGNLKLVAAPVPKPAPTAAPASTSGSTSATTPASSPATGDAHMAIYGIMMLLSAGTVVAMKKRILKGK